MAALEKLIEYRKTYLNRADDKINRSYLSMIDEAIAELSTTQHRLQRLEKIYSGIDNKYVDDIIDLPDVVFDKFINYILENELTVKYVNELARLIIVWEKKINMTIQDYFSIKYYKQLINSDIPQDVKNLSIQIVNEFEERSENMIYEFKRLKLSIGDLSDFSENKWYSHNF